MAEDTIAKIGIDVDVTGAEEAASQLDKLGKTGKKTEEGLKGIAKGANKTNGPFRAMRGSVQQVSWQLQDVAVQAQMGTSAFTILGQQGPQLASIFGPGGAVVGAIIAFGAMAGGVLYTALSGASALTKELAKKTENLFEKTDELNGALKELATLQAARRQEELRKAIVEATKAMESSEVVIASVALGAVVWDETLKKANDTLTEQKGIIAVAKESMADLAKQNNGVSTATEKLTEKLVDELVVLQLSEAQLNSYKAAQAGATEAQAAIIVGLYEKIAAQKLATKKQEDAEAAEEKAAEKKADFIAKLDDQHFLMTLVGKDLYTYQANQAGATDADRDAIVAKIKLNAETKAQIKLDEEAAKVAQKTTDKLKKDKADAVIAREKDQKAAEKLATAAAQRGLDSITQLALEHQAERDQLQADLALTLITQEAHDAALIGQARETAEALSDIDKKAAEDKRSIADAKLRIDEQVLASAAGIVGQLSGIAEEGSREAKILFAMQKALAIAQIIVATEVAAQAAAAQAALLGGPVAWYATQGMIRAMGYASAGIVAGTAIAGGRALGGQVRGGQSYLVGERGPELLTMGTSGRIATNENLKNAVGGDNSSGSNVVNVNFSVQANDTAGFDRLLQSRRGQIVGMINQAVNNRGRASIV